MTVASSIGTRTPQIEPYTGQLGPEVPQGNSSQFYTVSTNGSAQTQNRSCFELFDCLQMHGQALSFSDPALQPMVTKDLIEEAIKRINICFAEVANRVVTHANQLFGSTFGGPPAYQFQQWPMRWSGENLRALTICGAFCSAAYQVPRLRSNALDSGVVDNQAATIVRPLFDIKAEIMRQLFGLEVQGEVNPDEVDAMLAGVDLLRPQPGSDDKRRESLAGTQARHDAAMGNESLAQPSVEATEAARAGFNVWTWRPQASDWVAFAALLKEREMTGVQQVPLTPYPFSPTVVGSGMAPGGQSPSVAGARTPQP